MNFGKLIPYIQVLMICLEHFLTTEGSGADEACSDEGTFYDRYHSQEALIVDLSSSVELSCHYCFESEMATHLGMLWYKFEKIRNEETGNLLWQPKEVKLDYHDNHNFNRVFQKLDHTLVIKDFQPDDVGTYICEAPETVPPTSLAFTSEHIDAISAASMAVAWQQLGPNNAISYLHHIDMELPTKFKVVSEDDSDYPKPEPPLVNEKQNWVAYTKWEKWGKCNVCGAAGERRRKGHCMVTMIDETKQAEPKFLDEILRFYPSGAPCHTTLFVNFADITKRQSEVEVGQCKEACNKEGQSALGVPNFNEMIMVNDEPQPPLEEEITVKEETLNVNLGDPLRLECPGAELTTVTYWLNNTEFIYAEQISLLTNGRVMVNVTNDLVFSQIVLDDNNTTLSCWVDNAPEATAIFHIVINPESIKEDIVPYLKYLLMSYAVNFVIAVIIAALQYTKTKGQVTKDIKRKSKNYR